MSKYQILFLGPNKTGKTKIIDRLEGNDLFDVNYTPTIGSNPRTVPLYSDSGTVQLSFNEMSLQTSLSEKLQRKKIKNSHIICIIFSVEDNNWQQTINTHLNMLAKLQPSYKTTATLFFVGTQADNPELTSTVFTKAQNYATKENAIYIEVSARINKNIDTLQSAFLRSVAHMPLEDNIDDTISRRGSFSGVPSTDTRPTRDTGHKIPIKPIRIGRTSAKVTIDATPVAQISSIRHEPQQTPQAATYLSAALRVAGIAIMLAGLVSIIYFIMLATSTMGTPVLAAIMNHMVGNIGGLLGMSASSSIAAFSNSCATVGVSAETATAMLGAIHGVAMISGGYKLFDTANKPSPTTENNPAAATSPALGSV